MSHRILPCLWTSRRVAWSAIGGAVPALVVLLALVNPLAASAATPAPAWTLQSLAQPTHFSSAHNSECLETLEEAFPTCDRYTVTARNVGAEPTAEEPSTVEDQLPSGLTAVKIEGEEQGAFEQFVPLSCELANLSCVYGLENGPLPSGGTLTVTVFVTVASALSGSLTNTVHLSGAAPPISTTGTNLIESAPAPFGIDSFAFAILDAAGSPYAQAAGHPAATNTTFNLSSAPPAIAGSRPAPPEEPKSVVVDLPPGLIGDPLATPRCTEAQLQGFEPTCPAGSQIGYVSLGPGGAPPGGQGVPLYNMVTGPGHPAVFGFNELNRPFFLYASVVPSSSGYFVRITVPGVPQIGLGGSSATIFGDPASHTGAPGGHSFLTDPSRCDGQSLTTTLHVDSWQVPGAFDPDGTPDFADPAWKAQSSTQPPMIGCERLQFSPTVSLHPDTAQADSPAGLDFDLAIPQAEDPEVLSTPDLRDATVSLPPGAVVNPASAGGLQACSAAQIDLESTQPGNCPAASKVATVAVRTPLLSEPLAGDVFLGTPECGSCSLTDAESGKLLHGYIEASGSGVVIKLPGSFTLDPGGRITAHFEENPQLPFDDFKLDFKSGPRAPVTTPATCGTYTATSDLKPWSAPQSGPDATPSSSFQITSGPGGAACVKSEAEEPNNPSFEAGTVTPLGGTYSPLVVKISRADGTQRINDFDLTLPPGLLGKLAGIPYCPEAAIAAAEAHGGVAERQHPSCPAASQLGTVDVGLGAGSQPFHTSGKIYLAGPYKGAPISLVAITPAVAGPFDLGTVVDRVASYLAPEDIRIHSVSGILPHILDGIPLDIRSITVDLDRPEFIVNPTNCEAMSLTGSLTSLSGSVAPLATRFQVGGCAGLPFKPKFSLRLKGGTRRHQFPSLNVAITFPKGPHANFRSAVVSLPHSEFVEQGHIRTICTRVQFAAGGGGGEQCPAGSIYGHAEVQTPLLDQPLVGPVFQRSSDHELPDLAVALRGQIDLTEDGVISSDAQLGIRSTFSVIPDANFSRFHLQMQGGKRGLIVNSENICDKPQRANVKMVAQNGKVLVIHPLIANHCKKHAKKKPKAHRASSSHGQGQPSSLLRRLAAW
jgi:hypothetical protein